MDLLIICNDRKNVVQNMGIEPGTNMTEAFTEIMHLITRY
jgi:pheromone shutdown protein TraB